MKRDNQNLIHAILKEARRLAPPGRIVGVRESEHINPKHRCMTCFLDVWGAVFDFRTGEPTDIVIRSAPTWEGLAQAHGMTSEEILALIGAKDAV